MSTLLEQASLIMIPSGYKEDVVYSVIPENGNGDLSFTRASNGTRVNSAGLVEDCPWNLVQQSETFGSAPWTPNNATITANSTTAPNGTTTADTFTLTPGTDSGVYQALNGESNNYTISVYAKYVSGDKYLLFFSPLNSQTAKVWFDIQNGTVSNQVSGFVGTIENVGNGWYKCSMYNTNQVVLDYIQFAISTTNSSRTLSNNSVSYFWGAQVNVGTAKPYFPTTDRLNVPRLTYQNGGGGCPSLLLEKQSTNLFTYSEQFDNAAWTKSSGSVTANQAISPDGTQNADLLVGEMYQQPTFTNATTYSFSIFAKKESGSTIYLGYIDNVTGFVGGSITYTYSTGVVAVQQSANGSVSGQAIDMGNGWIRVIMKYTTIAVVTFNYQYIGSTGSYLWGAQCEVSSYATSYIGPTTSSSATRVADECSKTGISSLIGQTEGVVFWDIQFETLSASGLENILNIDNGSFGNTIYFIASGNSNIIIAEMYVSSVLQASFTLSSITAGRYKIALGYANNNTALFINGTQVGSTDTSCSVPAMSRFQLGNGVLGPSDGKTNQAILFPTRLTNAELASLTTL